MAGFWQWQGDSDSGAGYMSAVANRDAGTLHRNAKTTHDKVSTITITATANDTYSGSLTAASHGVGVAPGNAYGSTGMSSLVTQTPTLDRSIGVSIPQAVNYDVNTYYDICLSTATTAPLWVARVTETQRASGCRISAVATVTTAGITAVGTAIVGVVGTGIASTNAIFAQNNAYIPASVTPIITTGKTKAYIYVKVVVTDLRSAPTLNIVPFLANQISGEYHQGQIQTVYLLTGLGQAQEQVFELDLDGATGLVVLMGTIAGQGTAVTIHVELV